MLLFQLIGVPFYMFLLPFAPQVHSVHFWMIAGIGIFEAFVMLLLFYALHIGEAATVLPTTDFYALISAILGIVFFHESFYLFKALGMAAIVIGIVLIGLKLQDIRKTKNIKLYDGIPPAVLMAVGTGIYFFLVAISSRENGWFLTSFGIRVWISITCFLLLLLRKESLKDVLKNVSWNYLLPAAFFDVVSFSLYSYAVSFAELSYVTMIFSAQSVITVILAYFFLKERLTKYQVIGLGVVFVGLILLQLR